MKAVVFSGTTEGRGFSRALAALGAAVTVCVATGLGAEEQGRAEGITVRTGRLDAEEMTALLRNTNLCVDATHPYATEATRNIRAAAGASRGGNTTACCALASTLASRQCRVCRSGRCRSVSAGQAR